MVITSGSAVAISAVAMGVLRPSADPELRRAGCRGSRWLPAVGLRFMGVWAMTERAAIQTGVLVLVYADMRMREEGMDLVLQQAANDGRLSGEEFATTGPGSAYAGGLSPAGPPAV